MSMEADREARRAKVRAMMAARNAGTEPRRMTVRADEVREGDWVYRIRPIEHLGRTVLRGMTFEDGDGARVIEARPHRMVSYLRPELTGTEDGNIHLHAAGHEAYKVPAHMDVDILRRVPA